MEEIRRGEAAIIEGASGEQGRAAENKPPSRQRAGPERRTDSGLEAEKGRGRTAEKPSDIQARGWKDILLRVYRGISDDRILVNAAAVTFYALLALFPAIAALVSIYGIFADPGTIEQQLASVSAILPGGALDVIRDQLHRLVAQPRGTLSVSFVLGLIISLWSANGAIKAMFDALNVVYQEREERSFIKLNAITLAFTVAMIAFVLVALALACIYRYGPSRDEPKWRWLTWGSAFAALVWLGFSAIFSFYAANFGTFNKTYGSLGAVIGFMTWMWLSVAVILIGGKLDAEMERPTARDSTEGPPQPIGARRAK